MQSRIKNRFNLIPRAEERRFIQISRCVKSHEITNGIEERATTFVSWKGEMEEIKSERCEMLFALFKIEVKIHVQKASRAIKRAI